jgi:hemerythrin
MAEGREKSGAGEQGRDHSLRADLAAQASADVGRSMIGLDAHNKKTRGEDMPVLEWTPEFDIGIYEIDLQHRSLVSIANQLYDAIEADRAPGTVEWILEELLLYTRMHFQTEEQYMQRYEPADSARHKREHGELLKAMRRLKRKLAAGDDEVGDELLAFLSAWLADHLKGSDRSLGEAFKARGEGRMKV